MNELKSKIIKKISDNIVNIGNENPKLGNPDLTWRMCEQGYWVAGFYVGELWLSYLLTGDQKFANQARMRKGFFEHTLNDPELINHDMGFLFSLSSVADYKMTGDKDARELGIKAADALRSMYQCHGKFLQAWPLTDINVENRNELAAGRMLIDSFENLALLFWAHQETGIQSYYDVAFSHALTAAEHLIRKDGSTFHTFKFDAATQKPIKGETLQGHSDDSCWSRGQSWAIHGLSQIYRYTKDERFLIAAQKVIKFAIVNLNDKYLCPWDYTAPIDDRGEIIDSSATAIMAAGLAAWTQYDDENSTLYKDIATKMVNGLTENCALFDNEKAQGLLDFGAYFVKRNEERAMLPYGDYFYFEAIMRLDNKHELFW